MKQIVQQNLFQSATHLQLERKYLFQQHNEPKHRAKTRKEWLEKKGHVLEWSNQSPIENLWHELKKAVHQHSGFNLRVGGNVHLGMEENATIKMSKAPKRHI